jgi:hypothetical protein
MTSKKETLEEHVARIDKVLKILVGLIEVLNVRTEVIEKLLGCQKEAVEAIEARSKRGGHQDVE